MIRKSLTGAVAALALIGQASAAQAQEAAELVCVPADQADALVQTLLPDLIVGLQQKCGEGLAADAALNTADERINTVYRPAADAAWPNAINAVMTLGGDQIPEGIDPVILRPVFLGLTIPMLTERLGPDSCGFANEVYEALSPLPPENISMLAVTVLRASSGEDAEAPIRVCAD